MLLYNKSMGVCVCAVEAIPTLQGLKTELSYRTAGREFYHTVPAVLVLMNKALNFMTAGPQSAMYLIPNNLNVLPMAYGAAFGATNECMYGKVLKWLRGAV